MTLAIILMVQGCGMLWSRLIQIQKIMEKFLIQFQFQIQFSFSALQPGAVPALDGGGGAGRWRDAQVLEHGREAERHERGRFGGSGRALPGARQGRGRRAGRAGRAYCYSSTSVLNKIYFY